MFRDFNKYEIYDDGSIWSYARNKWRKPFKKPDGYWNIVLRDNDGNLKNFYLHRVIYEAVSGQPIPDGMDVNHINEDKSDNRFENLNLMTRKENVNFGTGIKRRIKTQSKSVAQYDKEGNVINIYPSLMEVHRQLGFSQGNVSQCCNGRCKQAYGFIWRYVS